MYSKILPVFEFLKRPENIPPNNDQQKKQRQIMIDFQCLTIIASKIWFEKNENNIFFDNSTTFFKFL